ncbi:MAG: hypothetical protein PHN56_03990 [Candidatus Nanoarchaeia archaeon]|nr:hypothetical protein [Candidatus Nanoarchaeia archaeon]
MKTEDFLNEYRGSYKFVSPYHKNKKYLPFAIIGKSYSADFPIECETVMYCGWNKSIVLTGYTVESLLEKINSGYLIKCK